jgi:cell wall-associated NlpC family hydrolase
MTSEYKLKEIFIYVACSYLGVHYEWSGNGRDGIDCSGLICAALRSVENNVPDMSSQMLYKKLVVQGGQLFNKESPTRGDILFFGKSPDKITHVAIALSSGYYNGLMIEAAGGGRTCTSKEIARKRGAEVRIRPISSRKDLITCSTIF